MNNVKQYVLTFLIGLVGAVIFNFAKLPLPWLLGPTLATLIVQLFTPLQLKWKGSLRDLGIIVVSLSLGSYFTLDIFLSIPNYLIPLIILNLILIGFSVFLSWITSKICGMNFVTSLVASVPGGLSQLLLFAEEKRSVQLPIVTYFQVVRVLVVVTLVPIIMSATPKGQSSLNDEPIINISVIILILLGYIMMRIAKLLKFPVVALLGPLIFVICLNLFQVEHAVIQSELLNFAQIFVGCHIGLSLKRKDLYLSKSVLIMGVLSSVLLVASTMGTAYFFSKLDHLSYKTSFLSLAPGGLDQMSLIALNVGGDVALVTLFQLFRILFILLIVLPSMNLLVK